MGRRRNVIEADERQDGLLSDAIARGKRCRALLSHIHTKLASLRSGIEDQRTARAVSAAEASARRAMGLWAVLASNIRSGASERTIRDAMAEARDEQGRLDGAVADCSAFLK